MFLTPRWIASHVFVAVLIAAFVAAGLWQLDRLDERQSTNARIESRLDRVVELGWVEALVPQDAEYHRVVVEGEYRAEDEVLVGNRVSGGSPGFWIWTVLDLDGGGQLFVNRGFIDRRTVRGGDGSGLDRAAPVPGPVTVVGVVRRGIDGGAMSSDRSEISRPDARTAGRDRGLDHVLDPALYIELETQEPPPPAAVPVPVPPPDLGEGPHRSYAFQWFTFALLGTVGYAVVLFRIRRGDTSRGDVPH